MMSFHICPQQTINLGLIASSLRLVPLQHITVNSQSHLYFILIHGKPLRTTALANFSGVTSGQSDRSISSSVIVSSRCQSVSDLLEIGFLLIFGCLSCRNNAYVVFTFCMNHCNNLSLKQTESHKPLFSVVKAIVFNCYNQAVKNSRNI